MKKHLLLVTILIAGGRSVFAVPVTGGGDSADEYLHGLITGSSSMDTVVIPLDSYHISGTLDLEGLNDMCIWFEPGSEILLDDVYRTVLRLEDCSNVVIMNVYLSHVEPLDYDDCHGAVVWLGNSSGITFDNCSICGCGSAGFTISDCRDVLITHCEIMDNSNSAFSLLGYDGLRIVSCSIHDNGMLINSQGLDSQRDLDMANNLIFDNRNYMYQNLITGESETPGLRPH